MSIASILSRTSLRSLFAVAVVLAVAACSSPSEHLGHSNGALQPIACATKQDCVARGGDCQNGQCVAANECAADADCPQGQVCVADANFGGLCAISKDVVQAGPAWPCMLGRDCPTDQGCGSDNLCHVDGECNGGGCGAGQICYDGGNGSGRGFCADERPDHDPYCRSDGQGACRNECDQNGACVTGAICQGGFCHESDECTGAAQCGLNHLCVPFSSDENYGFDVCAADPNPMCVDDGHGACRLACASDADCVDGGACGADQLCHASDECVQDADCPQGQVCYASMEWGGLCGASGR